MAKESSKARKLALLPVPPPHVLFPSVALRFSISNSDTVRQLDEIDASSQDLQAVEFACVPYSASHARNRDLTISPNNIWNEMHHDGCVGRIVKAEYYSQKPEYILSVEGLERISVEEFIAEDHCLFANVSQAVDSSAHEIQEAVSELKAKCEELLELLSSLSLPTSPLRRLESLVRRTSATNYDLTADTIMSIMESDFSEKLIYISERNPKLRVDMASTALHRQLRTLSSSSLTRRKAPPAPGKRLAQKGQNNTNHGTSNPFARGHTAGQAEEEDDLAELERSIQNTSFPSEVEAVAKKEFRRLRRMHPTQAEYNVLRTYLETLCDVPFNVSTEAKLDRTSVQTAREILDNDHYGLEDVKKRLIEYLAVLRLKQELGRENSVSKL